MCIAIVKKSGVELPTREVLSECWNNNPDGAGYMFIRDGQVHIRKGFMRLKFLLRALRLEKFTASDLVSYHFRIATSGGVNPENTHPFPVSNDRNKLKSLHITTDMGAVHNGIIQLEPNRKDDSDTQAFIYTILSEVKDDIDKTHIDLLIKLSTRGSKIALLDKTGFRFYGQWQDAESNGLIFSNDGWKKILGWPPSYKWDKLASKYWGEKPSGKKDCVVCNFPDALSNDGLCAVCDLKFTDQEFKAECNEYSLWGD